jgi:hypothetical protein
VQSSAREFDKDESPWGFRGKSGIAQPPRVGSGGLECTVLRNHGRANGIHGQLPVGLFGRAIHPILHDGHVEAIVIAVGMRRAHVEVLVPSLEILRRHAPPPVMTKTVYSS